LENQQIMQGKPTPPTPYSSPAHTQIHVEFTKSEAFQALGSNDPRVDIMTDHITGEAMAQEQRAGGGMMPGGDMQAATAPGGSPAALVPGTAPNPAPQTTGGANRPRPVRLVGPTTSPKFEFRTFMPTVFHDKLEKPCVPQVSATPARRQGLRNSEGQFGIPWENR